MIMYNSPKPSIDLKRVLRKECEINFPAREWGQILCDLEPNHTGAHSSTCEIQVGPNKQNTYTIVVTWTKGGDLETLTEYAPIDEALWAKIKNHSLFQDGPAGKARWNYPSPEATSRD